MKIKIFLLIAIYGFLAAGGCSSYVIPYLSLDLKPVYTTADIKVNYTYDCEEDDQRCVYALYNRVNPDIQIAGNDGVLPHTGALEFSGLEEGFYRLDFTVYTEQDGQYILLKFLNESYDFEVDYP